MTSSRPFLLTSAVAPSTEPLTLAETKLFLRVDGTEEDALITSQIIAAREAAEEYMQRSLITQTWKLVYDDYLSSQTQLFRGAVQSVTSVTIIARDGGTTLMNSVAYYLSADKTTLIFDATPVGHQVEILYVAGYGVAVDVPVSIKQGMLLHVAALYDERTKNAGLPESSAALYQSYRIIIL